MVGEDSTEDPDTLDFGTGTGSAGDTGSYPSMADSRANLPLHFITAREEDAPAFIDALVDHGADVNAVNAQGKTALHLACIRLQPNAIRRLLDLGADATVRDRYGATALHYAMLYQSMYSCVRELHVAALRKRVLGNHKDFRTQEILNEIRVRGYSRHSSTDEQQLEYVTYRLLTPDLDLEISQSCSDRCIPAGPTHLEVVGGILDHAADVNVRDAFGRTPMLIAASLGYTDLVKLVAQRGADVYAVDEFRSTTLHEAVQSGNAATVHLLLRLDARNRHTSGTCLQFVNAGDLRRGETALHRAARLQYPIIMSLLLQYGADMNAKDSSDLRPLHTAIEHNRYSIARKLVLAGASVNTQTNIGNTPLFCSISPDGTENGIVKFLLDHGADVRLSNCVGRTALHRAVWLGYADAIRQLCDAGADVNAVDDYGNAPVHMVDRMSRGVAEVLHACGADVNARNARGLTPLHLACLTRKTRVVSYLLNAGADCNLQDAYGATPLHYAVYLQKRFTEGGFGAGDAMIRRLLDSGADCNLRTKVRGSTALHILMSSTLNNEVSAEIVNLLVCKSQHSLIDSIDNSYVHLMAAHRGIPHVRTPMTSFNPVLRRNKFGLTPLHVNAKAGKRDWRRETFEPLCEDQDRLGRTCQHLYFMSDEISTDKVMSQLTAKRDFIGRTCLHYMCLSIRPSEPSWFSGSPLINSQDAFGRTPLFYAALYQSLEFVEELILAGADGAICDNDGLLPFDVSHSLYTEGPTVIGRPHVVVKPIVEQSVPSWATTGPTEVDSLDNKVYAQWTGLHKGRQDEHYNEVLRHEVLSFVSRVMRKVGELDPVFESEPTLVGSAREGTRAKTHDEFDFMIVLKNFESLEDRTTKHGRFPGYVRFASSTDSKYFGDFCDEKGILQPMFVKERLYTLFIQACSYPDVWEGGTFEPLHSRIESNLHSPAVTVKTPLNRLRVQGCSYFFWRNEVAIDFVPAVAISGLQLSPDSPFGRYIAMHHPRVDPRAFAVMKPHKYTIGAEGNGFCPSNFIILESEVVRNSPAAVRAAYVMLKHLLFCKKPEPVDVNKYSLKQCVLYCIVTNSFNATDLRNPVTGNGLAGCIRTILEKLWSCAQNDASISVHSTQPLPFWEFEPFAGFTRAYLASYGLEYTTASPENETEGYICYTNTMPPDMLRASSRQASARSKAVVNKFRYSYTRVKRLCTIFGVPRDMQSDQGAEFSSVKDRSRLLSYVMKFDDSTNEFYVNDIQRALLTPSPYYIGVPKNAALPILDMKPPDALTMLNRIYEKND